MTTGIRAIHALAKMGYRAWAEGQEVHLRYEGPGLPDPAEVAPLVKLVKRHKQEVRSFLKSFCARCGGVVFAPDYEGRPLCLGCDWGTLVTLYPAMAGVRH